MISVLFICTGNICRSPTAEGVFRKLVDESVAAGKISAGVINIDSAGTHGYHVGSPPDARAIEHAARRGVDIAQLRGRQVTNSDFERFDYVLVADQLNMRFLQRMCSNKFQHKLEYLLDYAADDTQFEVPDPYNGEAADFETALDLIEQGCQGLLDFLIDQPLGGLPNPAPIKPEKKPK